MSKSKTPSSPSLKDWEKQAATELHGKASSSIHWETAEGIEIKPLYTAEDLEKLGSQLNTVQNTYDGAMNKLTTGKGNIVKSALKLEVLGAKMKKPLPKTILEKSDLNLIE